MKALDRYRGGLVPLSHRYKFDPENKSKQGYPIHLYAIATTRDGAVVAINNHGVFRSEDEGKTCRLYTSGLNARSEFKPRNREVCHSSDSNPNGLRPWWQFFGSIIVAAESCQQGHEFR